MGLDWCLRDKPRKEEFVPQIDRIKGMMTHLEQYYDWKKYPEKKEEYYRLEEELKPLVQCPEETVGMKRLKDLPEEEQRKAFEMYAVPRIKDAQREEGHDGYIKHWKDMTFQKWCKDSADNFLQHTMPKEMQGIPRVYEGFQAFAGWMSFRGKCIANSDIISGDLTNNAYENMETCQMLAYANGLEADKKEWEEKNAILLQQLEKYREKLAQYEKETDWTVTLGMDKKKEEEFKADLKKRYGNEFFGFLATVSENNYYDYRNLCDAIMWLRFWGEKGHGMIAWY